MNERDPFRALSEECVVDASVLAKLFLPEPDADIAVALLQPAEAPVARVAPDLAYLECSNILWKWARRGTLSAEFVRDSVADLLALPLEVWPTERLVARATELALALDVTVYDAVYLALADVLAIPLVTADEALVRKAGRPSTHVRLLETLRPAT